MRKFCVLFLILLNTPWGDTPAASVKSVLELAPGLQELGAGWTTNLVAYLLDPNSQPSAIDYQSDPASSVLLELQRDAMKTNSRTGCALLFYGRGDLVMNSGLYRVYIQRWANRRALHNAWVGWKMNPERFVRNLPHVGEDYFWVAEWWRQTQVRQNLVVRRGLFHVVIEAGPKSDPHHLVRLAQVIDSRITGQQPPGESLPGS